MIPSNILYCLRIKVCAVKGERMVYYRFGSKGGLEQDIIYKLKKEIVEGGDYYYRPF